MFKILSMLIPFFKEMIFGIKSEHIHDTFTTKVRKWFFLILVLLSFVLNYFLAKRLYDVSLYNLQMKTELVLYRDINEVLELEKQKNHILNDQITTCYKNLYNTSKTNTRKVKNNLQESSNR